MNTIPIVTVGDLSTDSFTANRKGIDIKLSQASGNGLKHTESGLVYLGGGDTAGTPRVLLGAFSVGSQKTFNFNNELNINLNVVGLGSDGDYLYYSLNSPHQLRLSHYNHQDANTYNMESGEVEYGQSFQGYSWDYQQHQKTITYQVDGVTRTLMLSYVKLDGIFFIWCDILSTAKVGFIEGDWDGGVIVGGIQLGGKSYDEYYISAIYDLNHILVEGDDGVDTDVYLTKIGQDGIIAEPLLSFLYNDGESYPVSKYNYSAKLLALSHNNGGTLTVVDIDDNITVFETGKTTYASCIEIYPDPDSDDMFIAVAFVDDGVIDIYRYATDTREITKHVWFDVNFNNFKLASYLFVQVVKPISTEHIGIVLLLNSPEGGWISKAIVIDTSTDSIVAEQVLANTDASSSVENQNWIIDWDIDNNIVNVYQLDADGITSILQHPLSGPQYALAMKVPYGESTDPADKFPGMLFGQFNQTDGVVLTPYSNEGVPTLDVKNVLLSSSMSRLDSIGVSEVQLGENPFIAYVNVLLQAHTNDITIVD